MMHRPSRSLINRASPVPSNTDFKSALLFSSSSAAQSCSCSANTILATEQPNDKTTKTVATSNCFSAIPAAMNNTKTGNTSEATCARAQRLERRVSLDDFAEGSLPAIGGCSSVANTVAARNGTLQARSQGEPVLRLRVD